MVALITTIRACRFWLMALCLGICAILCGCSAQTTHIHDFCDLAKPIILKHGEAATLSDETARQILTHDETYEKICGKVNANH